jgi:ribosomal protein S18 acetylase RimI-like enzyme
MLLDDNQRHCPGGDRHEDGFHIRTSEFLNSDAAMSNHGGCQSIYGNVLYPMIDGVDIIEAQPADAAAIAAIHIEARRMAMPYLPQPHTEAEILGWFASIVGDRAAAWWVARCNDVVVGYMLLDGDDLDDLYVHPDCQGRGIGSRLLETAKSLNPRRLALSTFQRNTRAQAFYEAHGFRAVGQTDGRNEEGEPDVQYEWMPQLPPDPN